MVVFLNVVPHFNVHMLHAWSSVLVNYPWLYVYILSPFLVGHTDKTGRSIILMGEEN